MAESKRERVVTALEFIEDAQDMGVFSHVKDGSIHCVVRGFIDDEMKCSEAYAQRCARDLQRVMTDDGIVFGVTRDEAMVFITIDYK